MIQRNLRFKTTLNDAVGQEKRRGTLWNLSHGN